MSARVRVWLCGRRRGDDVVHRRQKCHVKVRRKRAQSTMASTTSPCAPALGASPPATASPHVQPASDPCLASLSVPTEASSPRSMTPISLPLPDIPPFGGARRTPTPP
eukprot:7379501-Prymnesium_polylepis.1